MKTLLLATLILVFFSACKKDDQEAKIPDDLPKFEAALFATSAVITNPLYGPPSGKVYFYEAGAVDSEPDEQIIIERKTETKVVYGITCIIHHDLVKKNGVVIEDTDDWLAQDKDGNIWYFGETVKNYDTNGNFEDSDGSWEAGVDSALPGYWIPIAPTVGQKYYQEYYKGEAEDQAEVLAIDQTVTIALGTYEHCVETKDYTVFEQGIYEKKFYAPGIGFIKEEKYENDVLTEVLELIEISE